MTTLNRRASEIIVSGRSGQPFAVHALTDITGFGLIGHAREMALGSNVSLRVSASRVPLLAGALDCAGSGFLPGGLKANREFADCIVTWEPGITEELQALLFDPQTAGGLLISVAGEQAAALVENLRAAGVPAVQVGSVLQEEKPRITVTP